jgi:succinate-semialdehyde dehydrogenase/glutarate-semialdehyde dehydrogenase
MFAALQLIPQQALATTGLEVTDPATQAVIATVRSYTPEQVEPLIEQAAQAMHGWANQPAKARAQVLQRWFQAIMAHQEDLAQLITAECGKPIAEARGEVAYGASFIEWFGEEAKRVYGEIVPTHAEGKRILVLRQPIGVCAAITPWNFPLAMITRKVAPALAAGCPILLKPAEATPLTALAIAALATEAGLPEGLFQVVPTTDPAGIGQLFCASTTIRKLSFTGSTQVGRLLMRQAANNIKKLSLELGGNAPFIVFDDANLDHAIEGALASKYRNAGQTCVCVNRFLVQAGIYEAFTQRFSERVAQLKVGAGVEEGSQIGPLINAAALTKVQGLVDDAVAQGAKVTLGGAPVAGSTAFYQPTVITHVDSTMRITQEEIFGPVSTLIRFETEAEAIAIANDTPYGLAAYFYANDLGRVWRVMEALEYGKVGVNEGIISTEVAPFGGIKQSGLGREGSRHGIDEYTELKYALVGGLGRS